MNREGKKVLLVKHKKLGVWIYPGGNIEENENPLECAIRETEEETGISVEVISPNSIEINANTAQSLPQPLIIMGEDVPYKDGHHEHFGMIYPGIADSMKLTTNEESLDCKCV
jgi:8-oxo-dGTP pyrophosphatase MutT (NUDIX family)